MVNNYMTKLMGCTNLTMFVPPVNHVEHVFAMEKEKRFPSPSFNTFVYFAINTVPFNGQKWWWRVG